MTSEDPFQLAVQHAQAGRLPEAIDLLRRVIAAQPSNVAALNNLGVCSRQSGRGEDAAEYFRRALAIAPDRPHIWNNYGNALRGLCRLDEAGSAYERSLSLNPDNAEALCNLGTCLKDAGRIADAVALYRRSLALSPSPVVHSNLLYALHFLDRFESDQLLREHRAWAQSYADPLRSQWQSHANDRTPNRRLRVGYVSPDLRLHPVGRFLRPLLAHHNRDQFEVVCYATGRAPDDAFTQRLRSHADAWRPAGALSDDELAWLIRDDRIDVLVDLSLHMANNRLLVFAGRPAPVQVTYLAYCGTSGMDAMDYRLTDGHLDPQDDSDAIYSERSIRLLETYWCYDAPDAGSEVLRRPGFFSQSDPGLRSTSDTGVGGQQATSLVRFASLNNFSKVSDAALETWAKILLQVPDSTLLLHALEGSHRQRVRDVMTRANVDPNRIEFVGFVPLPEFFALHNRIDIALDPFPYAGGTTTCDALWMGAPVVTLKGRTAVGRGGVSILSNVGLSELIASEPDEYVRIATGLARSPSRVNELRASLRARMEGSPLMNAARFAAGVEVAFQEMWRRWCDGPSVGQGC